MLKQRYRNDFIQRAQKLQTQILLCLVMRNTKMLRNSNACCEDPIAELLALCKKIKILTNLFSKL